MAPAALQPDATLAEFLHARALATAPGRLGLDLAVGTAVAAVATWARPAGWLVLASAGLCFAMYAVWAISERHLQAESRDMRPFSEFAWIAARIGAAGLGLLALMAFLFALLRLALGTWIS